MMPRSFSRRFVFNGKIALQTGLHIGSSWTVGSASDNAVIRLPDGRPFIPGSSFKGAFRSTVEKLASTTGLSSCLLLEEQDCIGAPGESQRKFNKQRQKENWNDEALWNLLEQKLCDTCKLFGSNYTASRISFADLLTSEDDGLSRPIIQIRDGVAIDRDSEKAVDGLKYDYEVVAPAQIFNLQIVLEDPSAHDLSLTCLGLNEFVSGFGYLGGKRSRGLGNCRLEALTIHRLDLSVQDSDERAKRLKQYLLGRELNEKMEMIPDAEAFLVEQIEILLTSQEDGHA